MKCGPRLEHGGNLKVKESRPRRHMSYGSISNKSSEDTNSIKTEKRLVDVRGWSGETGGGESLLTGYGAPFGVMAKLQKETLVMVAQRYEYI